MLAQHQNIIFPQHHNRITKQELIVPLYKWGNYEINKGTKYISVTKRSVVERPIRDGECMGVSLFIS